ncbi:unnamed protein product [Orchesella dallaii]|uniref:Uncharacterized protein n=1 Tax=Orchesella dallaii TaxID=48710 RepID=A0ABP1QGR9_9HEXA
MAAINILNFTFFLYVFNSLLIQGKAQPVENGKNVTSDNNSTSPSVGATETVDIYIFNNFFGVPWSLRISNCTNVPAFFYKKTSSINTNNNCVILFSRENCEGRHLKIAPGTSGHSHLSEVNFDETLVSLKPCDDSLVSSNPATSVKAEQHKRVRRNSQILSFLMQNLGLGESGSSDGDIAQLDDDSGSGNGLQSLVSSLNFKNLLSQFQQQDDGSE